MMKNQKTETPYQQVVRHLEELGARRGGCWEGFGHNWTMWFATSGKTYLVQEIGHVGVEVWSPVDDTNDMAATLEAIA